MSDSRRFNIRVYGIWIDNGRILVNEELIRGQQIVKFPGGGLNWGEGTVDCLRREWKEELNIDIDVLGHFYTTDYFQPSAFDDSQVISIYYLVGADTAPDIIVNTMENERTYWIPLNEISGETFSLAIDKKVGDMLYLMYNSRASEN